MNSKVTMFVTELPPILNSKEYQSLQEKYNKEEQNTKTYYYKPYRTLHNY